MVIYVQIMDFENQQGVFIYWLMRGAEFWTLHKTGVVNNMLIRGTRNKVNRIILNKIT